MYKAGDLILYGGTGVCRVAEVVTKKMSRTDPERLYYVLKPLYQTGTITTPVDNTKVFIRPVISREDALALIAQIPTIDEKPYHNQNLQQLETYYKSRLESHNCLDLLRLTVSTYRKKIERERAKLKFGAVDRRYMERAENLLYGELAVALGTDRENVQAIVSQRLETLAAEQAQG